tara:strand:- start:133 stop:270 length:138 start_codon:yes stop_codon:yes gene_type:complete
MIDDEIDAEIEELRLRRLIDQVCSGVIIPSDEEIEKTASWQDCED